MRLSIAVATVLLMSATSAHAGRVAIEVVDAAGRPVADAVVSLAPGAAASRSAAPVTRYVDQKDETFVPYVTAAHPGDSVVFRNSDNTQHHVYSFSDIAKFEYMLSPGERSPPLVLATPGYAAVGCNIHDHMLTYVYVTTDPGIVTTDAKGRATLDGLAAGQYQAHAWHPQLRRGVTLPMQAVAVNDATPATLRFVLALTPDPRGPRDREHIGY
jgi:plastocyanin